VATAESVRLVVDAGSGSDSANTPSAPAVEDPPRFDTTTAPETGAPDAVTVPVKVVTADCSTV
jgi:hypothetical protein